MPTKLPSPRKQVVVEEEEIYSDITKLYIFSECALNNDYKPNFLKIKKPLFFCCCCCSFRVFLDKPWSRQAAGPIFLLSGLPLSIPEIPLNPPRKSETFFVWSTIQPNNNSSRNQPTKSQP